jgi:hypothetical protein
MPQIMTEAFARGLLDKIMIEVLDIIDRDVQNGKVPQGRQVGRSCECNGALNSVVAVHLFDRRSSAALSCAISYNRHVHALVHLLADNRAFSMYVQLARSDARVMRELSLGKSWGHHIGEETDNVRSEYDESQVHERTHTNYSKAEEMELIAKIVSGLRDIQIGDSRYVLPPSLLALEKQVICLCSHKEKKVSSRDIVVGTRLNMARECYLITNKRRDEDEEERPRQ